MPNKILGNEIPEEAVSLLQKGITTAIIATVDKDGYPRTTPFGWITAKDKATLRVAVNPNHRTFENISRDGKVMVCVIDEGNISLGIKGNAKVIKERMESPSWHVSIVEINVLEVKSDALIAWPITHGIRWLVPPGDHENDLKAIEELRTA